MSGAPKHKAMLIAIRLYRLPVRRFLYGCHFSPFCTITVYTLAYDSLLAANFQPV
jgi:hypothetical protein